MAYGEVAIYSLAGDFLGYTIKSDAIDPGTGQPVKKLQTTNLYLEGEEDKLKEQLERLNQDVDLRLHWPNPKDPEVMQLLNDPDFIPLEYELREVVDDETSYYVWKLEPEVSEETGQYVIDPTTGQPHMIQGTELDEMSSVVRYKQAYVPKRPTDVMWRIKLACEKVARQRARVD
jgi:hypothetical protein